MDSPIWKAVAEMYYELVTSFDMGDIARDVFGNGTNATINKIYDSLNNLSVTLSQSLEGVGAAIAALFFIISLVEFAMSDRLTIESFIKFFAKLVIAIFLIANCAELTTSIIDFGNGLGNVVQANGFESPAASTVTVEDFYNALTNDGEDDGLIAGIGAFLSAFSTTGIMHIAAMGIRIVLYVIGFSRMLELMIRGAFMPVAIGLISDDGWKGAAGRYIKKFVAICAQASILAVLGTIMTFCMLTCLGLDVGGTDGAKQILENKSNIMMAIGVGVAGVAVMFKSIGIVNDVFGA